MLLRSQSSWFFTGTCDVGTVISICFPAEQTSFWRSRATCLRRHGYYPEELGGERTVNRKQAVWAQKMLCPHSELRAWCLAHVSRSYWPHSSSAPSTLLLMSLPGRRHMGPVTEEVLCAHQTQMDPSSELGSCHWILTKGMCGKWRGSLQSLALKKSPWFSICCSGAEDLVEHSETLGEGGTTQLEDVQVPVWLSEAKLFQPEPYWTVMWTSTFTGVSTEMGLFVIVASLSLLIQMLLEGFLI